jgi:hypothetical protein
LPVFTCRPFGAANQSEASLASPFMERHDRSQWGPVDGRGERRHGSGSKCIRQGEVIWLPSLLGLGSRIAGDYKRLDRFLRPLLQSSINAAPFSFEQPQGGMVMKTLRSQSAYLTIVVNKSKTRRTAVLHQEDASRQPKILFANKNGTVTRSTIHIAPEETMVIEWSGR